MWQYEQLAQHERCLISELLQLGLSQRATARRLGRSPSTISRGVRRNATTHDGFYRPSKGHRYAMTRRSRSRRGVKFKPRDYELVWIYLSKKWSPQQISQRLGQSGELDMSHESIYQYIRRDRRSGGNLFRHCRVANELNTRPRKRLGYSIPEESYVRP